MADEFQYDLFLSHSSKDKEIVRAVAERLRKDGLRVWFDEWVLKPGDSIPAKIEVGLERSRVFVLCMSANAFGSDWAQLESYTFRFRDPLNKERRFIPLRLDDAPIKGSLAQFLYIKWEPGDRGQWSAKLHEACVAKVKPAAVQGHATPRPIVLWLPDVGLESVAFSSDGSRALCDRSGNVRVWDLQTRRRLWECGDDANAVEGFAITADHRFALTSTTDQSLRVWEIATGLCLREFKIATRPVTIMTWSRDRRVTLCASGSTTAEIWDVETGQCLRSLVGHARAITALAWSPDECYALSGCADGTVRVWNVSTGQCLSVLVGHTGNVTTAAWSPDQKLAISGSDDKTVRLWDIGMAKSLRVFEGHSERISNVIWRADCRRILSASYDKMVRLWDVELGRCVARFEAHTRSIIGLGWTADQCGVLSADYGGAILKWNLSNILVEIPSQTVAHASVPLTPDQVQYTNAKVLLVGDSGVGKSGLSNYLAHGIKVEDDKPIPSTDGAWATHWPLPHDKKEDGVDREIWLWDFAGQVDYRLVHQLYMDDTAAAVLVFNPQSENPFEGLGHWDRDLQKAARRPFAKLLAAGRVDRGGLVVSAASMKKFMAERGFQGPLHLTSAKTEAGCDKLGEAIVKAIDWQSIPKTTSPALYHRMKQEILSLRDGGLVLIRLVELKQRMEMTLRGEDFKLAELEAVVSLLSGPGMIQRLDFGGFILLQPEVLSRYAAAVVRKVRQHPQEMGCIREDELLAGDLDYQDFKRLPHEDETVVLRTLIETFVSRAWCLRHTDGNAILTFPSYFRRERKAQPGHPSVLVTYRFDGPTDEIYATLVVRLHHTVAFKSTDLWRSAADFKTQTEAALGFTLSRETEGTSLLEVYFAPEVDESSRVLFLRYIHDHLMQYAQSVVRLRQYYCRNKKCDATRPFPDQAMIDNAIGPCGKGKVFCPVCGKPIPLRDTIEVRFESPEVKEQVRELAAASAFEIDSESRELILVGHAYSIVAEARQIYRGYTNSDHGIDGEIEFKDDEGRASGKRLYVQLKSDDAYLKSYLHTHRRDGVEVFQIKNPHWADYWQQQAYAVMLVIRTSDAEIRWMDVTAYLKRESDAGKKPVKQIVFDGERFDLMSVRRWRDKTLTTGST